MSKSNKQWVRIVLPTVAILLLCIVGFVLIFSGKKGKGNSTSSNEVTDQQNSDNQGEETKDVANETSETAGQVTYTSSGVLNTGNLSETGDGYEGIKGTGNYNYGEALQKSLLFYELQRSGDIDENNTRCNWRGDSCLNDGQDAGLDLTGGWLDAGDNVKFNLPMSYTAAILAWSVYEDKAAYEESGQLEYALGNIKWANDYFIKCHPEDEVYYYQVGSGSMDHSWWGPVECVEIATERPSYCVTKDAPGSTVCGETAASLALCSIVYADIDKDYSATCLSHAKSLFKFAEDTKSDAGYTAADGFYTSNSGYYDELSWAAVWLYRATGDKDYLTKAEDYYSQACQDYIWAVCWDDVHIAAALILAEETKKDIYKDAVETHLDWWTTGTDSGERITYTPDGLAWLDTWGSLRYATTTAFVASVYSETDICTSSKKDTYWDFAVSQADYALGSTGFSYQIGYGDDYPQSPHHRTAQGSYCNNMNEPNPPRHTLYGALVGGPDSSDGYTDDISNYTTNEVACDYNAGFTGLLANLYSRYHGETLINFGAVEPVDAKEIYADASVNVDGQDFIELRCFVYNTSAWPARVPKNLELRYYVDLSEVYKEGGSVDSIEISTNYMQGGTVGSLVCQDEDNHIYYMAVNFADDVIYPGGQDAYKREVQVRLRNPEGAWDNTNDPSYSCLDGSNVVEASAFAIFEDGTLVFGEEPTPGKNYMEAASSGKSDNKQTSDDANNTTSNSNNNNSGSGTSTASSGDIELTYKSNGSNGISGELQIKNKGTKDIAADSLAIYYYLTDDNGKDMTFENYNSAINGANGSYNAISNVKGSFKASSGTDADTVCVIEPGSGTLAAGDTLSINFAIHYNDWSNMNTSNDYSAKKAENIVIKSGNKVIFGTEP